MADTEAATNVVAEETPVETTAAAAEAAAPAAAKEESAKRAATTDDADEPSAKRATTEADKPSEEPDEHGFVHPAVMAAMDPQSEEYTKAYAAFESNSALYYEKYGDYYKQQAASGSNGTTLAEGEVEEVCEVPDRHIGRVIGKGGQTVRTIQGISSTHIDIPNECAPGTDMRMVKIRGTPNNISYCRKIIAEYVSKGEDASMPLPSESEVDPTKPITCKTIEVPDEHVGRIIGKGGATVRMIQDAHHCHVDIAKAPPAGSQQREVKITGVPDSIAATEALIMQKVRGDGPMGGMPLLGGALGGPLGQNEIRVFVPAEHVGRIIGRGGATIREIQERSGAHMDINKETRPGSTQREIVLRGSPQQHQFCIQLVNQKIAEMTGDFSACYVVNEQGMPAVDVSGMMGGFQAAGFYGQPAMNMQGGFGFGGYPQAAAGAAAGYQGGFQAPQQGQYGQQDPNAFQNYYQQQGFYQNAGGN